MGHIALIHYYNKAREPFMEVTIQKAAVILGISPSTIRRRISEGALQGHQRPTPGGLAWFVELPEERGPNLSVTALARVEGYQDVSLRELVDSLRGQVRILTEQLTTKDRQIEQLHVLLQQATLAGSRRSRWFFGSGRPITGGP